MLRNILGVIIAWVVMSAFVFATFTVAYIAMGQDRAFEPGVHDVSLLWIVVSTVLTLIAAILGGWLCAAIAKSPMAWKVLAALMIVIGLLMAVMAIGNPKDPGPRTGDVSAMEAMQNAQTPTWIALINPFIGAIGVAIGAMMKGSKSPAALGED